jgi:mannose-6-phosphate isomerase-like protein (cupin superfamily)
MLNNPSKNEIFTATAALIRKKGFTIIKNDLHRPWGGFFVIDEAQAAQFANQFFPEEDFETIKLTEKLSPKILVVAPGKRLSWQYHHRRAELWKCIEGEVAVMTSLTDEEEVKHILKPGDIIKLKQGERHRLIGLKTWGIVAEIWQHTDADNPSDEDDIIRLQDDFGR